MVYAGFWKRLGALLVDLIVFLPVVGLIIWLDSVSRTAAVIGTIVTSPLYFLYETYFHARYGQTLGKMAVSIRVLKPDGQRISIREALLRGSVDFVFGVLVVIGSISALLHFPATEYSHLNWLERQHYLQGLRPGWYSWVSEAQSLWVWSETFTVLFNRKKRALHDFLAGTVVAVIGSQDIRGEVLSPLSPGGPTTG